MAAPAEQAHRQDAAGRGTGVRDAAPDGFEPEVPSNYVAPGEGEFLSEEIERQIEDIRAGRTKLTRYSSGAEYIRYVRKMLSDDTVGG